MTLVQEKEAEMVLQQKTLISKLSSQLSQAKGEADKLKRQDALKRLALKRLHSAFEHGEAEVEQAARSQGGGNKFSKGLYYWRRDIVNILVRYIEFFLAVAGGGASHLRWYVPWTHSLATAVKAATASA